jgi:hypothetical protein
MRIKDLFDNVQLTTVKFKLGFLETTWEPLDADKDAAWDLYVELITRITTQPLAKEHGDEATALTSVYNIFGITRSVLKHHGRGCEQFSKIAVVVLNQRIRPFTAKWHKRSLNGAFDSEQECARFREELSTLQEELHRYTKLLALMADVEDLTAVLPEDRA